MTCGTWPGRHARGAGAGGIVVAVAALVALPAGAVAAPLTRAELLRETRSGVSVQAVVARSFPEARLGRIAGSSVRVLIADSVPRLVLGGRTPLQVTDERYQHVRQVPLEADHRYEITTDASGFLLRDLDAGGPPRRLRGPVRVDAADATSGVRVADPLDRRYRGSLRLVASPKAGMQVVNEVDVEGYLRGAVAGELPVSWGRSAPSALRVGAIAFRSRTLARLRGRAFAYDVNAESPRYLGLDGERTATNQAVEASAGLTLMMDKLPFEAALAAAPGERHLTLTAQQGNPALVAGGPSQVIRGAGPDLGPTALRNTLQYLGLSYLWGGTSPQTGFDCSGMIQYVYGRLGITLPRVAEDQAKVGQYVPRDQIQPGDALFFADSSGYIHHEGLYIGDNKMVHSPKTGDVVKISDITSAYYTSQYAGARRYSPSTG